jgi:hypothetical protein
VHCQQAYPPYIAPLPSAVNRNEIRLRVRCNLLQVLKLHDSVEIDAERKTTLVHMDIIVAKMNLPLSLGITPLKRMGEWRYISTHS